MQIISKPQPLFQLLHLGCKKLGYLLLCQEELTFLNLILIKVNLLANLLIVFSLNFFEQLLIFYVCPQVLDHLTGFGKLYVQIIMFGKVFLHSLNPILSTRLIFHPIYFLLLIYFTSNYFFYFLFLFIIESLNSIFLFINSRSRQKAPE